MGSLIQEVVIPELSPIESEFASTEEAEAYDHWLRAKVQAVLDENGPTVPHDEAMAEIRGLIEEKQRAAARLG